jgi:hypothetical protein
MRRGFGLIGLVLTAILLGIVGVIAYNVGWSDGAATHVAAGTVAPPYYYGYGPGPGFGIFGFLWFLFVLFILFGLLRFAFFGRRHWGGGGWGYKGGRGYGIPSGQKTELEEKMHEWHKQAHGEQPSAPGSTTPPPPSPDQRTV